MILTALVMALALQTNDEHKQCLADEAAKLEVSGEAADIVAKAVVYACIRKEAADKPGSIGASMTADDRRRVTAAIREAYERRIIVSVVRARACRKTKLCPPLATLD